MKTYGTRAPRLAVKLTALPLVSWILLAGAMPAQQPIVARVAQPGLRPAMQIDPGPAGQPEPPQTNSAPFKDDLFAGTEKFAKGASDVTEVTMDPDSLNLVGGDSAKKARHTLLSVVRTYSYDKPGMYNPADVEEYRRKLETGDWHCSVHIRELKSGESTDICSRRRPPDMVENAIITMEPKEVTFIHTIKKINGQGGSLDLGSMPYTFVRPPLDIEMALMQPEMAAEIMAQTAEIRSRLPEMMESLQSVRPFSNKEMQEQMKQLQRQFNTLQSFPKLSPEEQRKQHEKVQHLDDQLQQAEKP